VILIEIFWSRSLSPSHDGSDRRRHDNSLDSMSTSGFHNKICTIDCWDNKVIKWDFWVLGHWRRSVHDIGATFCCVEQASLISQVSVNKLNGVEQVFTKEIF
jgi:hypothetical protein